MNKPISLSPADQRRAAKTFARGSQSAHGLIRDVLPWSRSGNAARRFRIMLLIFLGWTAVGLLVALPVMYDGAEWRANLLDKLVDAWSWAILTPALVFIDRNFAARRTSGTRLVLLYVLLCAPLVLVHTVLTAALLYPFPLVAWSPFRNSGYTVFYVLGGLQMYAAVVAILQALRFHKGYISGQLQLERVQKNLLESRLNALRLHLEPHFLFNTLNTISSEVADNPHLARDMIGDLGSLLRRSLDCKDSAEISLAKELAVLDHYLAIQRVRFGDRIKIEVDVAPDAQRIMVPPMLLQPLVENAIRHGLEGRVSGGKITVSAVREKGSLLIRVSDDGEGLPRNWKSKKSAGHGLRITRERLEALYPQAETECLKVENRKGGGAEVRICIPLHGA